MKRIVFTGGGTMGHVTKNRIVLEALRDTQPDVERHYVGLASGKEAEVIQPDLAAFHPVSSGKLRRYFSLQTIPDAFRFMKGLGQSYWKLGKLRPQVVFSSGGYVALPVALAARLRGIPVVTHETDSYAGLANRLIGKVADKILLGYETAAGQFDANKVQHVGNPVAPALLAGSRQKALQQLGFAPDRKTLMVMGGSQGAQQINQLIWDMLPELSQEWQVIHLTGRGKKIDQAVDSDRYKAFEYVQDEYSDFLNAADLVVSRAGGNSIAEIAALGKPAILIPLPLPAAAGDHQRKNALEMLERHSDWQMLESPSAADLLQAIERVRFVKVRDGHQGAVERRQQQILNILSEYWDAETGDSSL